jgi:hypothetical protein
MKRPTAQHGAARRLTNQDPNSVRFTRPELSPEFIRDFLESKGWEQEW